MKKYTKEELAYFGLSEDRMDDDDDGYGQNPDEDETKEPLNKNRRRNNYGAGRKSEQPGNEEKWGRPGIASLKHDDIKQGDTLQTTIDQWLNGVLIPSDTLFTVIGAPQKVRKSRKDDMGGTNTLHEYIVHGKTLLPTGQVMNIRINLYNCAKTGIKIQDMDEGLKW